MAAHRRARGATAEAGFTLRERLTDLPALRPRAVARPAARPARRRAGRPGDRPGRRRRHARAACRGRSRTAAGVMGAGRVGPDRPARAIDTTGRTRPARRLRRGLRRLGDCRTATVPAPGQALRPTAERPTAGRPAAGGTCRGRPGRAVRRRGRGRAAAGRTRPAALHDAQAIALLAADGADLDALAALADDARAARSSATT